MRSSRLLKQFMPAVTCFVSLAFWSSTVLAHSLSKRFGDFYGGMLHPLTAVQHLATMIGISLLAGQQGPEKARWVVFAFPAGLLPGGVAAWYLGAFDAVTWINNLSLVVVGILVATAVRLPIPALVSLAFLLGLTHGYENAMDVSSVVAWHLFLPGILTSGIAVVAVAAAMTISLQLPWQKIAVRVAGSWIAAIGLLIVGLG